MRSEGRRAPDVAVRVLDPKVSADTVNGYLDTLAHVVPAITDFFNPAMTTRILLVVDPGYTDGPAAAGDGVITVSAAYARAHPRDLHRSWRSPSSRRSSCARRLSFCSSQDE